MNLKLHFFILKNFFACYHVVQENFFHQVTHSIDLSVEQNDTSIIKADS